MELDLKEKLRIKIFRSNFDFSSEKYNIINLNLLFAVPDQKSLGLERAFGVNNLGSEQVMVVMILAILANTALLEDLRLLFHLNMAHKTAVWLSIVLGLLLWLRVEVDFQVVEALVEKFNVPERLQVDRCFNY
jgi:hypothetical protein